MKVSAGEAAWVREKERGGEDGGRSVHFGREDDASGSASSLDEVVPHRLTVDRVGVSWIC